MSESENKKHQQIIELDFDFNDDIKAVSEVFFKESQDLLEDLDEHILKLEARPHDQVLIQGLFRKMHTLKGIAGAIPGGQLFGSLSHEFETLLDRLRKQSLPPNKECIEIFLHSSRLLKVLAQNLRMAHEIYPEELSEVIELISKYGAFQIDSGAVNSESPQKIFLGEALDEGRKPKDGMWLSKDQMATLMQLSSEFIVLKNSFQMLGSSKDGVNELSHTLTVLSDQFQGLLDKAQKVCLVEALAGLQPLVRQATYELKKEVHYVEQGFDVEVDKTLAVDLSNALMHMVRNSIDHGFEKPDERTAVGKDPRGQLLIDIEERSSILYCRIVDDGRGLDKERILQRALEKGLTNSLEASQLTEKEVFAFIFHAGFSTKERITTMSGRGVGMDVVQNAINKYGGEIIVESKKGEGTTILLRLPVPRKVLVERCLLTSWNSHSLALPLLEVSHISSCNELHVTVVDKLRFCQYEDRTVPLLALQEIYEADILIPVESVKKMSVAFLKTQEFCLGLLVDEVQHQTDLVIKSFGEVIQRSPGFKGVSVLTDDRIAYVVDPGELRHLAQKRSL